MARPWSLVGKTWDRVSKWISSRVGKSGVMQEAHWLQGQSWLLQACGEVQRP